MKASINKKGTIILEPSDDIEAYALKCWAKTNVKEDGSTKNVEISTKYEEPIVGFKAHKKESLK